jgi:hypothetical protein
MIVKWPSTITALFSCLYPMNTFLLFNVQLRVYYVHIITYYVLIQIKLIDGLQLLGPEKIAIKKVRWISISLSVTFTTVVIFGLKTYPGMKI